MTIAEMAPEEFKRRLDLSECSWRTLPPNDRERKESEMARITEIRVGAERCFNDPYEAYANYRPRIDLTAQVLDGEDAYAVARDLQARAEELVEELKQATLTKRREQWEEERKMMVKDAGAPIGSDADGPPWADQF